MSRNAEDPDNSTQPKRRWLNIGPGLILALAVSALIGWQWLKTEMTARQQTSAPPIVERQVISSPDEEKSGPTPEVSFITDRAGMLHLTGAQSARLRAMQSEWKRYYAPKLAQAKQAAAKTNEYLAGAEGRSRTPVAQIRSAAAPVIALSAEISSARRRYWSRAVNILTHDQRKTLQAEREAAWAEKTKKLSSKN